MSHHIWKSGNHHSHVASTSSRSSPRLSRSRPRRRGRSADRGIPRFLLQTHSGKSTTKACICFFGGKKKLVSKRTGRGVETTPLKQLGVLSIQLSMKGQNILIRFPLHRNPKKVPGARVSTKRPLDRESYEPGRRFEMETGRLARSYFPKSVF